MKTLKLAAAVVASVLVLSGFTGCSSKSSSSQNADPNKPLVILADVKPHAELLKKAQELGLLGDTKIQIKEIAGDIDVNQLTAAGDVDANFFQHVPYLKDWNAKHGQDLISVATTHIEPLGLYSKKIKTLDEVKDGDTVAIPADPTNQARGLFLLSDAGLLTLNVKADDPNLDFSQVTEKNITANPKNIKFRKIERPQLFGSLADPQITLAIVNGNYAIEGGLSPAKDALKLEKAEKNPYANVLAVKPALKDDPRVKAVAKALTSPEIAKYIETTYQGSVIPAKS